MERGWSEYETGKSLKIQRVMIIDNDLIVGSEDGQDKSLGKYGLNYYNFVHIT